MSLFDFLKRNTENIDNDNIESDGSDDIPIASVTFFVNEEEEILIDCSWDEKRSGALHMANVIYKLSTGKLATSILAFLQAKCEENDIEDQYFALLGEVTRQYIEDTIEQGQQERRPLQDVKDKPLVGPTEVMGQSFRKPLDL